MRAPVRLFAALLSLPGRAAAAKVYVSSVDGSDSNSGTSPTAPLKTLRAAHTAACSGGGGSEVNIAGTFHLGTHLASSNAGVGLDLSNCRNTVWQQWSGKPPAVLSGGIPVTAQWKKTGGTYSACLPEGILDLETVDSVFVSGIRRRRARTATLRYVQSLNPSYPADPANSRGFVFDATSISASWDLSTAALAAWRVKTIRSWYTEWHTVSAVSLKNMQYGGNATIQFGEAADSPFAPDSGFHGFTGSWFVEGAKELTPQPGSGQFSVSVGGSGSCPSIVYAPTQEEGDGPPQDVVLPHLENVVGVGKGADGAAFDGLTLAHTRAWFRTFWEAEHSDSAAYGALAWVRNATGVSFRNVTLELSGGKGAFFEYSDNCSITRALVRDCGTNSIDVEHSAFASVTNSRVDGFGNLGGAAPGIMVRWAPHADVSHNEVTGGFGPMGVDFWGADDTSQNLAVRYNHIHHLGCEGLECISDMGGVHIYAAEARLPTFVEGNAIHHIRARTYGGDGIYLDGSTTAVQVRNNLVFSVSGVALRWHMGEVPGMGEGPVNDGEPTRFVNNVFAKTYVSPNEKGALLQSAVHWDGWVLADFARNVVYDSVEGSLFNGQSCAFTAVQYDPRGPDAQCSRDWFDVFQPANFSNNVYWNATGMDDSFAFPKPGCYTAYSDCSFQSLQGWQAAGHDVNSVVADPLFVDPKADSVAGFKLRPSSPAVTAMGFQPLPTDVGPNW